LGSYIESSLADAGPELSRKKRVILQSQAQKSGPRSMRAMATAPDIRNQEELK